MNLSQNCQRVLRAIISGAAGLTFMAGVHAQQATPPGRAAAGPAAPAADPADSISPAPNFSAVSLADSLLQITGGAVNVVVLVQPEGLLLVNGGPKAQAPALKAYLDTHFPGKPVKVLFNTDWHPQNTGFNETAAVSAPFTAVGAPPQVSIVSPCPQPASR